MLHTRRAWIRCGSWVCHPCSVSYTNASQIATCTCKVSCLIYRGQNENAGSLAENAGKQHFPFFPQLSLDLSWCFLIFYLALGCVCWKILTEWKQAFKGAQSLTHDWARGAHTSYPDLPTPMLTSLLRQRAVVDTGWGQESQWLPWQDVEPCMNWDSKPLCPCKLQCPTRLHLQNSFKDKISENVKSVTTEHYTPSSGHPFWEGTLWSRCSHSP